MTSYRNGLSFIIFLAFSLASIGYLIGNLIPNTNLLSRHYIIHAQFSNLNGLKVGSPVRISGVRIGQITTAILDPTTYQALLKLEIDHQVAIPEDSSLQVYSDGLVGSKFVNLDPGVSDRMLKAGERIVKTSPGVIIEEVIAKAIVAFSGASS